MTNDFFDELVWCKDCRTEMKKVIVLKNGFKIRALQCPKCGKRIYHPNDVEEFNKFSQLKQRPFEVKLRMVGNSYAVSIPKDIIDFMQEFMQESEKMHKDMVRLCLEEAGKVSLMFGEMQKSQEGQNQSRQNDTQEENKTKNKITVRKKQGSK